MNSSQSFYRCPVLLVVGDQAPYEEAAVSFLFFKYYYSDRYISYVCTITWQFGNHNELFQLKPIFILI